MNCIVLLCVYIIFLTHFPQTASDNDVAYSIMDVKTCIAEAPLGVLHLISFNMQQSGKCVSEFSFSQMTYSGRQGQACLPDLGSVWCVRWTEVTSVEQFRQDI